MHGAVRVIVIGGLDLYDYDEMRSDAIVISISDGG